MRKWNELLESILAIHGNKYDYTKSVFTTVNEKIEIICPIHGSFYQTPKNHLKGQGCAKCSKGPKTIFRDVLQQLEVIYSSSFTYNLSNINLDVPISKYTKIIGVCKEHGEFTIRISNHLNGDIGCEGCKRDKRELEYASEKTKIINKKFNIEVLTEKYNSTSVVEANCKIHGKFTNDIRNILASGGCVKCTADKTMNAISQDELISKFKSIHKDTYGYSEVNYTKSSIPIDIICKKHGIFSQFTSNHLKGQGCRKCTQFTSKPEVEISGIILDSSLNDRIIIKPLELDIYSEKYNFAVEYNGLMFHSFGKSNSSKFNNFSIENTRKSYHLNKTEQCENKGIQLFHIFENEWLDNQKQLIWKSVLNSKMGNTKRVFARKCVIREISNSEANEFLEQNHLQGSCIASIRIGLFYNEELLMVQTYGKSRFSKKYQYELIRMCSRLNYTVIGGASKLLKYFEVHFKPFSLVSYANRRWSQGNVYKQLGFENKGYTGINYFYFSNEDKMNLLSRVQFQKHKLKDKLEVYDEKLTETENMYNNNYRKIYDSGNRIYIKKY